MGVYYSKNMFNETHEWHCSFCRYILTGHCFDGIADLCLCHVKLLRSCTPFGSLQNLANYKRIHNTTGSNENCKCCKCYNVVHLTWIRGHYLSLCSQQFYCQLMRIHSIYVHMHCNHNNYLKNGSKVLQILLWMMYFDSTGVDYIQFFVQIIACQMPWALFFRFFDECSAWWNLFTFFYHISYAHDSFDRSRNVEICNLIKISIINEHLNFFRSQLCISLKQWTIEIVSIAPDTFSFFFTTFKILFQIQSRLFHKPFFLYFRKKNLHLATI